MLLDTQFLQSNVVLEHFSEVDSHTLANGPVDGVINVKFLKCVIAGVEDRENTDDTIVFNLVISQVEGKHLIVREEKFSNHHGSVCLNFVTVQVEHLKVGTVFQCLGQILGTITLDLVSLQVKTQKSG